MKSFMTLTIIVISLFVFSRFAEAHPPSRLRLNYEDQMEMLKIRMSHTVTNPKTHYIKKIKVMVNGKVVLEHTLKEQDTDSGQFLQYSIPDVKSGDRIRVEASCSSFGKKKKELKVE